ncbi:MAG: hypothetical protein AAFP19_15335 [Bacteroidota bacterium]
MAFKQIMGIIFLLIFIGFMAYKLNDSLYGVKDAFYLMAFIIIVILMLVVIIGKIIRS